MQFKTTITGVNQGQEIIRGYQLQELIQKKSFVEAIFLLLKGELPNEAQTQMMNALFTAAIDHGPGTASALTARIVASSKNSLHTAVAAGILAMGDLHGSAIEGAAKFFQENADRLEMESLLKEMKEKKVRVPGYGHAVLEHDHRADALFAVAKEIGIYGKHCAFAEAVREQLKILNSTTALGGVPPKGGKTLPLNVDGAMGAIISDMGFDWQIAKGFFIIARVPGLVAHVYEEMQSGEGLRRLVEDDIVYEGEAGRKL